MNPLRVFIGYDSREPVGYHVCAHSILARASGPVSITPLVQSSLRARNYYTRERGPTESTEFSMTRFLVPYLSDYEGLSVFMDSDMLCLVDIGELVSMVWRARADVGEPAVWVCPHDYTPKQAIKMDGKEQTTYPRKNWSSLMVFENERCRALTREYVNQATGLELHRFQWLGASYEQDKRIGHLPLDWNWLVGEYEPNPNAKILHYTNGLPCFLDYERCDHADLWLDEYRRMTAPVRSGPFARDAWIKSMQEADA